MRLLITALLFLFVSSLGYGQVLRPYEVLFFRNLQLDIAKDFPSNKFIYISMGRALPVLIALMQITGDGDARNLPFSGLIETKSDEILSCDDKREKLFRRLDLYLKNLAPEKTILVLDWVRTGNSLTVGSQLISAWAADRGLSNDVESLGIRRRQYSESIHRSSDDAKLAANENIYRHDNSDMDLNFAIFKYRPFFEFADGSGSVLQSYYEVPDELPAPEPRYLQLKAALSAWLKKDLVHEARIRGYVAADARMVIGRKCKALLSF
jgi:hypothetical protein